MKTILTLSLALVVLSHAYPPSSSFMLPGVMIFDKIISANFSRENKVDLKTVIRVQARF